jgi:hypothetical protein
MQAPPPQRSFPAERPKGVEVAPVAVARGAPIGGGNNNNSNNNNNSSINSNSINNSNSKSNSNNSNSHQRPKKKEPSMRGRERLRHVHARRAVASFRQEVTATQLHAHFTLAAEDCAVLQPENPLEVLAFAMRFFSDPFHRLATRRALAAASPQGESRIYHTKPPPEAAAPPPEPKSKVRKARAKKQPLDGALNDSADPTRGGSEAATSEHDAELSKRYLRPHHAAFLIPPSHRSSYLALAAHMRLLARAHAAAGHDGSITVIEGGAGPAGAPEAAASSGSAVRKQLSNKSMSRAPSIQISAPPAATRSQSSYSDVCAGGGVWIVGPSAEAVVRVAVEAVQGGAGAGGASGGRGGIIPGVGVVGGASGRASSLAERVCAWGFVLFCFVFV